jgi:hypothetical protein
VTKEWLLCHSKLFYVEPSEKDAKEESVLAIIERPLLFWRRKSGRRGLPQPESVDDVMSVTDMSYTDFVDGWNFYGGDLIENDNDIADSDTLMDEVVERHFSPSSLAANGSG